MLVIGLAAANPGAEATAAEAPLVATVGVPPEFVAFDEGQGRAVAARLACTPKHWRQIAPSVHSLAVQHADQFATLDEEQQLAALVGCAQLIDAKRKAWAATPVLAPGRTVIGLLDPAQGLGPREVIAIANAYGCDFTIFKKELADETLDSVAKQFLSAVTAAIAARDRGLIEPVLIGPEARLLSVADEAGLSLAGVRIESTPHSHASAACGVELVRRAEAEALMKGSLHTDELMRAVVARDSGLRTARRVSHVFVMIVPTYERLLLVTLTPLMPSPASTTSTGMMSASIQASSLRQR